VDDWNIGIVGGRDFNDWSVMCNVMSAMMCMFAEVGAVVPEATLIRVVSGGARGADCMGAAWGEAERWIDEVRVYPAEWNKYGKSAGYKRNQLIVKDSDILIAFWDGKSKGTKHSIDLAKTKGIPTVVVRY